MEMKDAGRAGTLMQVINILGDNSDLEVFLQFGQNLVRAIGLHFERFFPALIVELQDQPGVSSPCVRTRHILHPMTFP